MFKQQFNDGLLKIQETFFSSNGGARYDKNLSDAIYSLVQKWRESTWKKAIEFMTYSFKPGYNCPLPVPADFKKVYGEIRRFCLTNMAVSRRTEQIIRGRWEGSGTMTGGVHTIG